VRRLQTILLLCYPLAVHFALLSSQTAWALWLLVAVSMSQLLTLLRASGNARWMALAPALVLALCIMGLLQGSLLALYLPPILISGGLLWLFASTLRAGHEPLITTFARIVFQESEPQQLHYTRRVTQLWSMFFLIMLLETVLLSLFAPLELWSLFANILNYLFIALLFVVEFSYRRLRFPQRTPLKAFVQQLAATDWPALIRRDK
jgi:uncharacterized membrane protein